MGRGRHSWLLAVAKAVWHSGTRNCFVAVAQFTNVTDTSCWYKNTSATTFDYWKVEHSEAFEEANGYCYALNRFEGERHDDVTSSSQLTDRYSQNMNCSHRITDAHMAQQGCPALNVPICTFHGAAPRGILTAQRAW